MLLLCRLPGEPIHLALHQLAIKPSPAHQEAGAPSWMISPACRTTMRSSSIISGRDNRPPDRFRAGEWPLRWYNLWFNVAHGPTMGRRRRPGGNCRNRNRPSEGYLDVRAEFFDQYAALERPLNAAVIASGSQSGHIGKERALGISADGF